MIERWFGKRRRGVRRNHAVRGACAAFAEGHEIWRAIFLRIVVAETIERNENYVGSFLPRGGVGAVIDRDDGKWRLGRSLRRCICRRRRLLRGLRLRVRRKHGDRK